MGISVGIDLGTTYSAVATFDKATGTIRMLKNDIGEECTPSVVCIEGRSVSIGEEAKDQQAAGNVNTAAFYKSMMGDPNFSAYIDGKSYSAEELSGIYLKELKRIIEEANGVKIDSAVITVPAYFNEAQRLATQRAGVAAGMRILKLINEPTSAIIAYGLTGAGQKNVMVYDLGGGTFDVTIAHINGATVDVLATNGNHQLGGKDWDAAIIEEIRDRFESEFGIDINDYEDVRKELEVKVEKAKKNLTNVPATTVSVLCDGFTGKYEITREFFESATSNSLMETMMLVDKCFDEITRQTGKSFGWHTLDEVVLVGGSTRMPQISAAIAQAFGKPPIIIGAKVDTIVAAGAAMQASICNEGSITLSASSGFVRTQGNTAPAGATLTISGDAIRDVTSHSLGMLIFEDEKSTKMLNSIIIPKNSFVGKDYSDWYAGLGTDKIDVYVMQGESTDPFACTLLYKYSIHGLPKTAKSKFEVSYLYNQSGIVEVKAKDDTGKALKVTQEVEKRSLEQVIADEVAKRVEALSRKPECNITFVVDTSGSMGGSPISEARNAVGQFLNQLNGIDAIVSILNFAEKLSWECREETNPSRVNSAISKLLVDGKNGYGTSASPLSEILSKFGSQLEGRIIVVLTDGEWTNQSSETSAATSLKSRGATIYAVGIGDADSAFLNRIASQGGAQKIDLSKLTSTFRNIASNIATKL